MNAGLLGEHLASPRTATKTNQNTALEPKSTRDSAPSNEDGFAAYVAKETDAAGPDAPSAEDSVAPVTDAAPPPDTTATKTPEGELIGLAATQADIAQTDGPAADAATAEQLKTTGADLTRMAPVGEENSLPAGPATGEISGEPGSEDPRIRAATNAQDGADLQTADTVKLAQNAAMGEADAANDRTARAAADAMITARTDADTIDAEAQRTARTDESIDARLTNDIQARMTSADANVLNQNATPATSREPAMFGAEPTVTIGLASSGSAPVQVNVGLTPTPAAIPVAAPSDLTSVILNAVKNGADPQEQLVVQLDPPELGRVMIDFKFDAQGVQQVTVTSENPEALKRLRELHFELTQALRENGLSDQNMSFRQEAGDQSQEAWQSPDQQRSNAPLIAADERRASLSATPAQPNVQARDRLDLLL